MTTNRTTTYSADQVSLVIAGLVIDSGYADGEFVSVETAADDFAPKVGADGEVAVAKSNNRMATAHVKLLQTSLGNNLLSQMRNAGIAAPNGPTLGAFMLVDRSSGVRLVHADKCWIAKPPTVSRGREIAEHDWTIMMSFADFDFSGNPSV